MVFVRFENDIGSLTFGGADFPGMRLYSIKGLGMIPAERTTKVYNGTYGEKCTARRVTGRTITMSGELNSDYLNRLKTKQDMADILSEPGELTISNGAKVRKIGAEAVQLEFGDHNPLIQKFTLQFVCDGGVFYSPEVISLIVATVTKNIKGTFTAPLVFSTRTDTLELINGGHYEAEPIIKIHDLGARDISGAADSIVLTNTVTGKKINIIRSMSDGEVLTVDIPERRILSSVQDGDLYCFSADTVLADFVLQKGRNAIHVDNYTARNIRCVIEYRELYAECEVV